MKKNFVFIGESYLGGMAGSRRLQNLINKLKEQKEISVSNLIMSDTSERLECIASGKKNNVRYAIIRYSIFNPFSLIRLYMLSARFLIANKSTDCLNILYCYDHPTLLNVPVIILSKCLKFKVVIDVVEDYSLVSTSQLRFRQKLLVVTRNWIFNKIHWYADTALAISRTLEQKLQRLTGGKIPVHYLPISIDMSRYDQHFKHSLTHVKIFYGGSFGEKDGVNHLISAFEIVASRHASVELVLTGRPPKAGMANLLDQIGSSTFSQRIKFFGYLSEPEFYTLMLQCNIFCMTRINSEYANAGFPFKLGEMLATGKPVVSTRVGDVINFLRHNDNAILVEPGSTSEMAAAFEYLINNPGEADKIGLNGKRTAIDNFDGNLVAKKLLTYCDDLIN